MQLVFQDPYASLNPRMKIADIVAEPLIVHGIARNAREAFERVAGLLDRVGLPPDACDRYPHAFSGGQRQRVGIARALALNPEFIVADEPVSALDVSIRAQIINLMQDLQDELGLAYLFIAHDLAVVRHISHRIAIMYAGEIVEMAGRDEIYENPLHPYTQALLSAVPVPDPRVQRTRKRIAYAGEPPNPLNPPPGCRFQSRCPCLSEDCRREAPHGRTGPRSSGEMLAHLSASDSNAGKDTGHSCPTNSLFNLPDIHRIKTAGFHTIEEH